MEKQKNNYLVKYCLLPIKEEKHGKIGNEFQTTVCYIVSKAFIVEEYKVNFQSGTSKTTYKACFPYIVNNNRVNHLRKLPDDDLARNNEAVVSKLFDTYEDALAEKEVRNIFAKPELVEKYKILEDEIQELTKDLIVENNDSKVRKIGQK